MAPDFQLANSSSNCADAAPSHPAPTSPLTCPIALVFASLMLFAATLSCVETLCNSPAVTLMYDIVRLLSLPGPERPSLWIDAQRLGATERRGHRPKGWTCHHLTPYIRP